MAVTTFLAIMVYLGGFQTLYRASRAQGNGRWAAFDAATWWPIIAGAALAYTVDRMSKCAKRENPDD